jgi:hypothetical protein
VQQHDFTSLPVSVHIIFLSEPANPGAANSAAANNPKMACFIFITFLLSEYTHREGAAQVYNNCRLRRAE